MKALMKIILLIAVIGYSGYAWHNRQTVSRYGISAKHPLGEFEKLDRILAGELKMPKSSLKKLGGNDVTPTARMYQYEDPGNGYQYVVLLLDDNNTVEGVVGSYFTPSHSPVWTFMENHWELCGGPSPPRFTEYESRGIINRDTEFASGRVKGSWAKSKNTALSVPEPWYQKMYLRMD